MICALCGEPIKKNEVSVDHAFPKALYKWANIPETDELADFILRNKSNRMKVHPACNTQKGDSVLSVDKINALYIDDEQKQVLVDVRNKFDDTIEKVWNIKKRVFKKQHNCCYICGKKIKHLPSAALRRKSKDGARVEDNGMIICGDCNKHQAIVPEVREMLKRGYIEEKENGVLGITPSVLYFIKLVGGRYK